MRVLLLSATCSKITYDKICAKRVKTVMNTSQQFFLSLLKGFSQIDGVDVDAISIPPISSKTYPDKILHRNNEVVEKVTYNYPGFLNFPVVKSFCVKNEIKFYLKQYFKKYNNEEILVICDPLVLEVVNAAKKECKKHHVVCGCVLTDMPLMSDFEKHNFIKRIMYKRYNLMCQKALVDFDKYILLAENMCGQANPNNRPYMIMECIQDCTNVKEIEKKEIENTIPIVMYAGKLHKEFGMDILLRTAELLKNKVKFVVYGEGNYKEEFVKSGIVEVKDTVSVEEIHTLEKNADILINPRTSAGEYTKYSFPSKTAEYMLSGTPVVMFKLPAIPDEYEKYINYAKEETAEALADRIKVVLNDYNKSCEKAKNAANFIVENKNSKKQAIRIIDFLRK